MQVAMQTTMAQMAMQGRSGWRRCEQRQLFKQAGHTHAAAAWLLLLLGPTTWCRG